MIIAGSNLSFTASHRFEASHERNERLVTWTGKRPQAVQPARQEAAARLVAPSRQPPRVDAYQSGQLAAQAKQVKGREHVTSDGQDASKEGQLRMLLEKLFGVTGIKQFSLDIDHSQSVEVQSAVSQAAAQQQVGWGVEYDYHEAYREYEETRLGINGTFATADGRSFAFTFDYQMQREYTRTTDVSIRAGDALMKDPLVLDLAGPGGLLSGTRDFDLDGVGATDRLRHLTPGSYYLGADLDGDGRIGDGSELFGTRSGDGFADLLGHDQDGNGFIDAADPLFAQLRLWNGTDVQPLLLAAFKIAAIGVQGIAAPFGYKDADNRLLGENRKLGLYLTEDGRVGAVKQVDLVA
jgi:hypothetical protein